MKIENDRHKITTIKHKIHQQLVESHGGPYFPSSSRAAPLPTSPVPSLLDSTKKSLQIESRTRTF